MTRKKAIREFYIRPRYIVSRLINIRNMEDIKVLWKGFTNLFIPLVYNK